MSQFKLYINLGNEAMQTPDDVARALRKIVREVNELPHDFAATIDDGGTIMDNNGNCVGRWDFSPEEPLVTCKFCHKDNTANTAHLHQGEWVGECCWDERLKVTE